MASHGLFAGQFPFADNVHALIRKLFGFNDCEFKRAHGGFVGVAFQVIVQRFLPAVGYTLAANKHEAVAVPIVLHKRGYVAAVPAGFLFLHQACYFLNVGLRECGEADEEEKDGEEVFHGWNVRG